MKTVQTQVGTFLHNYGNTDFDHRVHSGIAFFKRGDWPGVPPTAQQIVEFLKDNIVAPEFPLDDEQVARNLGFLVGWILGEYTIVHGEEYDGRAGVFGPTRLARDMR